MDTVKLNRCPGKLEFTLCEFYYLFVSIQPYYFQLLQSLYFISNASIRDSIFQVGETLLRILIVN